MNTLQTEKFLVVLFCILFFASALFLFWKNEHELDPEQGKSWWTLSFTWPEKPESLDFTIENHSDNTFFQYEIVTEKNILATETFELRRGESTQLTPAIFPQQNARTSIIVTTGTEKKEIYR